MEAFQSRTSSLENNLELPWQYKHVLHYDLPNSTPRAPIHLYQEICTRIFIEALFVIENTTAQMSRVEWILKKHYIFRVEYYKTKQWIVATCKNMDEPQKHYLISRVYTV